MSAARNIIVRKARDDDYEGVLNIIDSFNMGADYIYSMYKELIDDPDSSYYVCEVDGEVAAFEGVSLIDENNTLMARSARVKEKFQGQGLLNQIRKKIYEDYKDVPGKKRIRTCCTNVVRLVHSSKFNSLNRTLATKMLVIYEPLETEKLPALSDTAIPEVREVDPEYLAILFQNKELVSYLFPEGFIEIVSWFFEPLPSNLRHIKKQSPYISISAALDDNIKKLTSFPNAVESQDKHVAGEGEENNVLTQGLFAVSTYYCNPDMIFFAFDIYGEPRQGKEEDDVKHIILHGLQYAVSVVKKENIKFPLGLSLSIKDGTTFNVCKTVLTSLGFKHGKFENFQKHFFYEQDFEKLLNE